LLIVFMKLMRGGMAGVMYSLRARQAGKTTQRVGPPTFRKVRHAKSFTLTQAGWKP